MVAVRQLARQELLALWARSAVHPEPAPAAAKLGELDVGITTKRCGALSRYLGILVFMTTEASNKDLLIRFIEEVWNAGIVDAADRYIAPSYTIHHDPGDPWDGKTLDLASYKARLTTSRAPFPDQRFTFKDVLATDDRVVMTWHWVATHKADLPGFPATGKEIRMSGATVYYLTDGRFTGHWQITDRLGVYVQLQQALASKG